MTRLLFAGLAIGALIAPAMAADLPTDKGPPPMPVPVFSWTGIYAGVNGGYGWENAQTQYSYSSIPAPAPPGFEDIFGPGGPLNVGGASAVSSAIADGFLPISLGGNSTGFGTVGGQIGYNYQIDQFVLGMETDFDWVSGTRSSTYVAPANGIITNTDFSSAGLAWLGTLRGRAGFAFDRALIFATGGLAYGRVTAASTGSGFDGFGTDTFTGSASGVRAGFAVGGGIEYAFTNNLSVKAEYLYYDLGTAHYAVAAANAFSAGEGLFINASQRVDGNIVRVGLNYKFDWGGPIVARY